MDERQRINYAKSELRNYKFLKRALEGSINRVEEIEAAIINYKTSPITLPSEGGGGVSKSYRKAELFDKLEYRYGNYKAIKFRVDAIDKFLGSLNVEDRNIVESIYIDQSRYIEDLARDHYCSLRTMKYRIDNIFISFGSI